jgi:ABC-2 type transport system permease protein
MKRLGSLVRVGLRSNFGLSLLRFRLFKQKKDLWMIPAVILGAAGLATTLYGYLLLIKSAFGVLKPLGQEQALPGFAILMGQFLILVFGLYYVISAFYFSKDLETLIPLPIKPFEVILSKFTIILVNEYLTMVPIVLPMLVYFGILSRGGAAYWVNALLVYLLLPIIPLGLVSIIVVGLMRVVNFSRKKDALIIVGSLVLIVAGLGFQVYVNRAAGSNSGANPQALASFFASPDSLLKQVGSKFPPSIWAGKALAGGFSSSGLLNLALLAGVSLLLFYMILVLAEKLFYRGVIGLGEVSGRKKSLSSQEMSRRMSSGRRPVRAIFWREWRVMNRTPIFLINGILTAFLVPLIFVLMATTGSGRGDAASLLRTMTMSGNPTLVILVAACFLMVCGCLNGTSSSSFSREGSQFWMSKVIPVSPREQVAAKFMHSYLVALLGIVTAMLVLVVVLRLKAVYCVVALVFALVGGVALTAVGMTIDLARPLLQWTNPQKAIKQNLNVVFALLAELGILAVLGYALNLLSKAGVSGNVLLLAALAALILLSWAGYHFLLRFSDRRYGEIEV